MQKTFKELTANEKHIFTSNLKRQIFLDSVQGRAPIEAFGPIVSLPEFGKLDYHLDVFRNNTFKKLHTYY